MTSSVVRVQRGTPFMEITHLLHENDVTAVPVVDAADRPVGVISQADLLCKESGLENLDDRFADLPPCLAQHAASDAVTAEQLMSSPAVCARPGWTVVEAARMMGQHRVKRLPVVDETGRLVGIVSRGDLLRVHLRQDRAIRAEIIEDVLVRTMGEPPSSVSVEVAAGRVVLSGTVARKSLIPVLVGLCRSVDGVVDVRNRLGFEADDTEVARSA